MTRFLSDIDWPVWLAREDVSPDTKAARLARHVAVHGTLPDGSEALWSEVHKLAADGRAGAALLPRLLRTLHRTVVAELLRSAAEVHVRSLFAGLIYACSVDASLKPALASVVRALDDERLDTIVRHLGPLAALYPADEPLMGKRLLTLLVELPEKPEQFSQRLATLRAGARWLPKGDDRVRAWRRFQESWEQFVEKCREKPGVFSAPRLAAEREDAAHQMVAALAAAMPKSWYPDDKTASAKCRLLAALLSQAGIPAEDVPPHLATKSASCFRTGRWAQPRAVVPVASEPGAEAPVGKWWILPALVGVAAVVTLAVAMTREIYPELWESLAQRWFPAAATADRPADRTSSTPSNSAVTANRPTAGTDADPEIKTAPHDDPNAGEQAGDKTQPSEAESETPITPNGETLPLASEVGPKGEARPARTPLGTPDPTPDPMVDPTPDPTPDPIPEPDPTPKSEPVPAPDADSHPASTLPLAEPPLTEIAAQRWGSSTGPVCEFDPSAFSVRVHTEALEEERLPGVLDERRSGLLQIRQEWDEDKTEGIRRLRVWARVTGALNYERLLAQFQADEHSRSLTFRLEPCDDSPDLQQAQARLRFCVVELRPLRGGQSSRYIALQKPRPRAFLFLYDKATLSSVAVALGSNYDAPRGAPVYLGAVRLRAFQGSQLKIYEVSREAASKVPTDAWELQSFYDDFDLAQCEPLGLKSLRIRLKPNRIGGIGGYELAVEPVLELTARPNPEVTRLANELEQVRKLREQLRNREQLNRGLNQKPRHERYKWLKEVAAALAKKLPDDVSPTSPAFQTWAFDNVLSEAVAAQRERELKDDLERVRRVPHPPELENPIGAALRCIQTVEAEIYRIARLWDGRKEQQVRVLLTKGMD